MRTFLIILIISWLLGIGLGLGHLSPALIIILSLATAIFSHLYQPLPVSVTAGILVLLGFTLGSSAVPDIAVAPNCDISNPSSATISELPVIKSNQVQYRAAINNCIVLITADRFPVFNQGQVIKLHGGKLEYISEIDPEYQGYADYLSAQGIHATWRFADITTTPNQISPPLDRRHAVLAKIDQVFTEPDASIVSAMLLADRGTIPENITQQFRATGVSHVLAISGLHLSLVAGALVILTSLLPLPPLTRTIITVILLWSYLFFITFPISAVRAGWFWTLALFAFRFHLLINLPTVLALAAVIMVTYSPPIMTAVGWQLSVSAVSGIFLALFLTRRNSPRTYALLSAVLSLLTVSLGAALTTWPLIAYYFGTVSTLNILANLLVVPVIPFILFLSVLALLVFYLHPAIALLLTWPVHLLISWLDFITYHLGRLPFSFFEDVSLPVLIIPTYYAALIFLSALWLKHQRRSWREIWQ